MWRDESSSVLALQPGDLILGGVVLVLEVHEQVVHLVPRAEASRRSHSCISVGDFVGVCTLQIIIIIIITMTRVSRRHRCAVNQIQTLVRSHSLKPAKIAPFGGGGATLQRSGSFPSGKKGERWEESGGGAGWGSRLPRPQWPSTAFRQR